MAESTPAGRAVSGKTSSSRELATRIRSVADMHIEQGANPQVVRMHVRMMTGVAIGEGGHGTEDLKTCAYCGASGGGGHGGNCPDA